ncbi:M56 family metallopeptidase [Mesoterricola silvestris]|uniref:Peptidase M56 domain-containing protein n=1 Tax=Mesoterricola silvestris TaxID=2927979 RepID=A0AA48GS65_9BACT|nr:M56 family metallopeptidase [Mesoterricola silvestris]BDU74695.1 hypothetical protein METEAL_38690 [Mesoterricola silvestris]
MTGFAASPLFQALGWTLVHSLWQGAGLGLLAWAGLRLLRSRTPGARYLLACGALGALPLASLATFALCWPAPLPQGVVLVADAAQAADWRGVLGAHLPQACAVWMAGVTVMGLRLLGGWYWIQRLRRTGAEPAPEVWARRAGALAERMGIPFPVGLLRSWSVDAPMVIGWIRPVILVPAAALAGLDPAALEAVLAHELAHVRRHDYLVNLMQSVVEALFFYHPAAWWISRQIRTEREHCCDDAAVELCGDPILYARALERLEDLRQTPEPNPALALAANGGVLMNRIKRLVLPNLPPSPLGRAGLLSVLAVTALGAASGLGLHQEPAPRAPEPTPKVERKIIHIEKKTDLDAKAKALEAKAEALARKVESSRKAAKADPELDRLQKEVREKAQELAAEARKLAKLEVRLPHLRVIEGREMELPELKELEELDGKASGNRVITMHLERRNAEVEELKAEIARLKARLDRLDMGVPAAPPAPPTPPAAPAPPTPPAPPVR